jgi:single-strand DNA-binding protein
MLLGNLTRDPVVKYTTGGTAVATFAIATNRAWTTSDGHTKEDVQYHNIVAWSKLAELVGKLLVKGRKVYVEGRLTTRRFTGKDGVERSITEIVMDDFIVFSDGKRTEEGGQTQEESTNEPGTRSEQSNSAPTPEESPSETVNPDDIPF